MTKTQAFSIGAAVVLLASGCGQIGNVQTPRNEFVSRVDADGNPTVIRTAETRAIIDLHAGREPTFPAGKNPRIVLRPTPGKEQIIPQSIAAFFPNEILMSRASGGYFAFLYQVPVTRYFRVLGKSDCDDAIWRQMTNTDLIKRFNQAYLGSGPRGSSYTWNCLAAVEYHWMQSNFKFKDSDGVIFDPDTAVLLDEVDKPFLGINFLQRVKMSGWAIKFVDPEPRDFEVFLADTRINSWTEIQQKQWQTLLFYIEKTGASEYAKRLVPLLPKIPLHSWRDIDLRILHTVAKIVPDTLEDTLLIDLLAMGVDGDIYSRNGYMVDPVAHSSAQNAPSIAANVLACRSPARATEKLKFIARNARFYNHRNAAVNALTYQGDSSIIDEMKRSRISKVNVDGRWLANPLLAHPFKCPYGASS